MNVTVACEGAGEGLLEPVQEELGYIDPKVFGAAHQLVDRMIEEITGGKVGPLFYQQVRTRISPRGGGLTKLETVERILMGPADGEVFIELCVFIIDMDNKEAERSEYKKRVLELDYTSRAVLAIARQEFESWLISDESVVSDVSGSPFSNSKNSPEDMTRQQAKDALSAHLSNVTKSRKQANELLREIMERADLGVWRQKCPSFDVFYEELSDVVKQLRPGAVGR